MVGRTRFQDRDRGKGSARQSAADQKSRGHASGSPSSLKDAWRAAARRIPEMRDDLLCYAAVQGDRARLALRRAGRRMLLGVAFLIAASSVFAIAVSLVIGGAAGGIAVALDGNTWLANLLTGAGVIVLLLGAVFVSTNAGRRQRMRQLEQRYRRHEERKPPVGAGSRANGKTP